MEARGSIKCTYLRDDDAKFQKIHTVEVALPLTDAQQAALIETIMEKIEQDMDRRGYSTCSLSAEMRHRNNGLSCKLILNTDSTQDESSIRQQLKRLVARLGLEPVMGNMPAGTSSEER